MEIAFDSIKDAINRDKHGVSLGFGAQVWDDPQMLIISTIRVEDGEQRFRAVGIIKNRLWTAVHVNRGQNIRMISVRKSNDGEQRAYDRASG